MRLKNITFTAANPNKLLFQLGVILGSIYFFGFWVVAPLVLMTLDLKWEK